MPLVKLGVPQAATGYGTNVSQLNLAFTRDTLQPWALRFSQEVTYKLFPQRAPWKEAAIDLSWLTKGTALECAQADEIRLRSGTRSINEVRDADGLNDIGPQGDEYRVRTKSGSVDGGEGTSISSPPSPSQAE